MVLEKIKMLLQRRSNSEFVFVPDNEDKKCLEDTQMKELGYQVYAKYKITNVKDLEKNIIAAYENKILEQLLKDYKIAKFNGSYVANALSSYMPLFTPVQKVSDLSRLIEKRSNNLISFTKKNGVRLFSRYDIDLLRAILVIRDEDEDVKNLNQAVDIIIEQVKSGNSPRSELQWILK